MDAITEKSLYVVYMVTMIAYTWVVSEYEKGRKKKTER